MARGPLARNLPLRRALPRYSAGLRAFLAFHARTCFVFVMQRLAAAIRAGLSVTNRNILIAEGMFITKSRVRVHARRLRARPHQSDDLWLFLATILRISHSRSSSSQNGSRSSSDSFAGSCSRC